MLVVPDQRGARDRPADARGRRSRARSVLRASQGYCARSSCAKKYCGSEWWRAIQRRRRRTTARRADHEPGPTPARRAIDLHDAGPMRALAHPMRLRILGLLRSRGSAVGRNARAGDGCRIRFGELPPLDAREARVRRAGARARARRPRALVAAAHEMTTFRCEEFLDDPERREAAEAIRRTVLDAYHRELVDALDAEIGLEPEWVAASDSSDGGAQLTLDEFRELTPSSTRCARSGGRAAASRARARACALDHAHVPEERSDDRIHDRAHLRRQH